MIKIESVHPTKIKKKNLELATQYHKHLSGKKFDNKEKFLKSLPNKGRIIYVEPQNTAECLKALIGVTHSRTAILSTSKGSVAITYTLHV